MKKIVFLSVIESILFFIIMFAAVVNIGANTTSMFAVDLSGTTIVLSTFFVILGTYLIGVCSGIVYSFILGSRYKDQIEFYARKNEKLSQQNEIDTDDKEALQRKIATLEIALNNALKNKE